MTAKDAAVSLLRRLREKLALRLMRRMHRLTLRVAVGLKPVHKARLLVVAPHMDDDVIGPGGTLLLHRQFGSPIAVVFCAAGSTPEIDATRKAESRTAAKAMGFEHLEWLDFPDGSLSLNEPQPAQRLARHLKDPGPEHIFCPFVSDHHRDHAAVAQGVAAAIRATGWPGEAWCYEVWSPLWPNVAVDISAVESRKREMIEIYASQTAGLHYADGILGLNRYRGLKVNVPCAEAFYVCGAEDFCQLADQMNLAW